MSVVKNRKFQGLTLAAAVIVCAAIWAVASGARSQNPPVQISTGGTAAPASVKDLSDTFVQIAQKLEPAVVSIRVTEKERKQTKGSEELDENDPMRQFFEQFFGPGFRFRTPEDLPERMGLGSGVIVDAKNGYILTNNHVVGEASSITVTLYDEREYNAKVIGTDKNSDVAIIQIKSDNLAAAPLGNSKDLKVGQIVLAIGSPFNLGGSVTQGIVSAMGRRPGILGEYGFENFIQTDAAINPGNSGGPLVNLNGEVIGLNAAIATTTGQYAGVGFAVPIDMVKRVMDDLVSQGKVTRGYLGVTIGPVDQAFAKRYGLDSPYGALVQDVVTEPEPGPAAKAGIEPLDLIAELNGEKVKNQTEFMNSIASMKPGDKVDLKIIRENGEKKDISATLAERPSNDELAKLKGGPGALAPGGKGGPSKNVEKLGLTVQGLTEELAQRFGIEQAEGVIVTSVARGSVASLAGFRPGMVITEVEREPVKTAADFQRLTAKALKDKGSVLLKVISEGQAHYEILEPPSE